MLRSVLGWAGLFFGPGGLLLAQSQSPPGGPLGRGPFGHMEALLERTIFKVDVLTVDLCLDAATAGDIESILEGGEEGSERREEVARQAVRAQRALAVLQFHRNVSMDQFLGGIEEDHRRAVDAGLLADSTRMALARELPTWYAFLETRGVQDGDRIAYRFEPTRVRVTYVGVDGPTYLDRTSEGLQRRASILGAYFAPGSSLRDGLLDSVLQGSSEVDGEGRCRALQEEWEGVSP